MCDCGCNTCETKGPLLTEGKVKSLLSEGLQYHIDKKIPLFETVYRIGSDKHLSLIKEARKMYSRNVIDLCEEDEALIKTHLGEFGIYEGESVPLDLPMLNEGKAIITFKNDYEVKMNTSEGYDDDFEYFEAGEKEQVYILDKNSKRVHVEFGDGTNAFIPSDVISVQEKSLNEYQGDGTNKISDDKLTRLVPKMPKGYVGKNTGIGEYTISTPDGEDIVLTQSKDKKNWVYEPSNVALKILNEFSLPKFDVVKPIIDKFLGGVEKAGKKLLQIVKREGKQTLVLIKEIAEYVVSGEKPSSAEQKKITEQLKDLGFLTFLGIAGNIPVSFFAIIYFIIDESGIAKDFLKLNEDKKLTYNDFVQMTRDDMMAGAAPDEYPSDERVRKDAKYYYNKYLQGASIDNLFEAEFRGKDVKLNLQEIIKKVLDEKKAKKKKKKDPPIGKPKRGGSKAYYVYVRDPKTKKVKKVSFGSGGLRAKIRNPKARKAFAARHNCKNKKDRTKAGYWSCNLPRYASVLGLGANMNTFW